MFEEEFDNVDGNLFVGLDSSTVRAGHEVTGCLVLVLHRRVRVARFGVHFHGEEHVKVPTGEGGSSVDETLPLFDARVYVWESADEAGSEIEAGTHTYWFRYRVPPRLPGSLTARGLEWGGSCSVHYSASAVMVASNCRMQLDSKNIKILEPFDPSSFSREISAQSSKKFLIDFGGRGPTQIHVSLPQSSFISGGRVPLTIGVDNPSSKGIEAISVIISEKITARTPNGPITLSRIISEQTLPHSSVPPRTSVSTTTCLEIPQGMGPSVSLGEMVRVQHSLETKLHSRLAFGCGVKLPLYIVDRAETDARENTVLPSREEMELRLEAAIGTTAGPGEYVHGLHSEPNQNPRKGGNEDRLVIACNDSVRVYATVDGHGGAECANFLHEHLGPTVLAGGPEGVSQEGLKSHFATLDATFMSRTDYSSGACCVLCAIRGGELLCAHVGDCRAILGRAQGEFKCLTEDHKPRRPDELERIYEAGGIVVNGRMFGMLAVSRAFGDRELKHTVAELAGAQTFVYLENPLTAKVPVTAVPETTSIHLRPDDEFLIVACDGVFDVMTNDEVHSFVRQKLMTLCQTRSIFRKNVFTPEAMNSIAKSLCMEAGRRLGHHDDISCIVVAFPSLLASQ